MIYIVKEEKSRVTVTGMPGDVLINCISQSVLLSKNRKCLIYLEFNGVEREIYPTIDTYTLSNRWFDTDYDPKSEQREVKNKLYFRKVIL